MREQESERVKQWITVRKKYVSPLNKFHFYFLENDIFDNFALEHFPLIFEQFLFEKNLYDVVDLGVAAILLLKDKYQRLVEIELIKSVSRQCSRCKQFFAVSEPAKGGCEWGWVLRSSRFTDETV